jgi:putative redox protein
MKKAGCRLIYLLLLPMKISLKRVDDAFHFEAKNEEGKTVHMDAAESVGGKNQGVRPMQMLLMGAAGCAAIDIISILKKQRQAITSFEVEVDGQRETPTTKGEAAVFKEVAMNFKITGNVEAEKAKRATELSMEKYCSASKTLKLAGAKMEYNVYVNNQLV